MVKCALSLFVFLEVPSARFEAIEIEALLRRKTPTVPDAFHMVAPSGTDILITEPTLSNGAGWNEDGVCSENSLLANLTNTGYIEFSGLPSPSTLRSLMSQGKPVILRKAGSELHFRSNMWTKSDILARYGHFIIPVGRGKNSTLPQEVTVAEYLQQFHQHHTTEGDDMGYVFNAINSFAQPTFTTLLEQDLDPLEQYLKKTAPFTKLPLKVCDRVVQLCVLQRWC